MSSQRNASRRNAAARVFNCSTVIAITTSCFITSIIWCFAFHTVHGIGVNHRSALPAYVGTAIR
nr:MULTISPECIES: hypothetical protein [Providencia]